ncbi:MAG: AsmA-like C-terminal region-containing protein [bacterium]|nr:AsmA-like C-terminal region-containing protein [bacterium]
MKAAILAELNKHLKVEVKVDPQNIDLTIIKTFPFCSIEFKNVLMLEALPIKNRDTLLYAGKLNLFFNVRDLLNKKYEVKRIKLQNGTIKLKILKDGRANYVFWDDTPNVAGQTKTKFDLNLITIDNCRLSYKDQDALFKTAVLIQDLSFKGHFNAESYDLATEGHVYVQSMTSGKNSFLKKKSCKLELELRVSEDEYVFKKANLHINKMAIMLWGKFRYGKKLESLDVKFNAPDPDIAALISLLPQKYRSKINDYESSGSIYARGSFEYTANGSYSLQTNFGIKQATITYKPLATSAEHVNIEGHIDVTDQASSLNLRKIYLKLKDDEIKGSCFIDNFSDPYLNVVAEVKLDLENLQNFWPIDTLSKLSGKLNVKAEIDGLLREIEDKSLSAKVNLTLSASIVSLQAQFKKDDRLIAIERGQLQVKNRDIEVKDLELLRGSSDLTLNGKVSGIFNYMTDKTAALWLDGTLKSSYIKMEDFMMKSGSETQTNDSPIIPANVYFNLDAGISKFTLGKFEAGALSGHIEIKSQKLIATDVKLETMDGKALINAFADNSKGKLDVVLESRLENLDIQKLFVQLNNFGQTTLMDKNIKGRGTATVDFSGSWNNKLESDPASIRVNSNLMITNGELIDFEPLLALSKFVEVEELKRIKFSTLQSTLQIKNSIISIPKTSVKNSALNIEVWGTHTFNNDIDYHIQLLINELLAKKRKKKDSEFGPIERDAENRRSAYILMTGNIDNPVIKYDKQGMKLKVKEDIKQEKQTVKRILKEEFGFYKKDTLLKKQTKPEPIFELEKPETKTPKKTLEPKKKKEDEDF